jgi:hypothetical protein
MHAEIMAYLTDYGSLSGEKGNGVITALPESSFNDLARFAAADFSAQPETHDEGDNTVAANSGPGELLDLGLPFYWPDAFGA